MNEQTRQLIETLIQKFTHWDYIKTSDLPNIDLYMDQVTTFMDSRLGKTKRRGEDKILTKTMINNYAKNDLLPPPEKKKYSTEHLLILIFIYYLKNMLSISDIQTLIKPLTDHFFDGSGSLTLTDIYEEVLQMQRSQIHELTEDIQKKLALTGESFPDAEGEEREFLQLFAFICSLGYDVYVKKAMIERLIDNMVPSAEEPAKKEDKKEAKKKASKKEA